ncbi:hypothetical protein M3A49_32370 [Paraburkholderia sp. CNPSo 3076]|uniref:hypothetical protein n=1 Tax=Paraburkholderia sp. CNPSo 3076 TaxID=2940936 RepID=UPI00224E213D|nr:hypothetical protein [Paraburkholderia sp. CNPSo 3076]MCX5544123.1 hypothetical protein [Paraburkholderia sp. CNPSo 3076]
MNQPQRAVLCATLALRDGDVANFIDWHTREHLVERLGISGFLRGRRFVQTDASTRYLIMYDVESLAALSQQEYVDRLNNPSPWTRAILPTFRDGKRSAYRLISEQSLLDFQRDELTCDRRKRLGILNIDESGSCYRLQVRVGRNV